MNPVTLFRQRLGFRVISISVLVVGSVMVLSSLIAVQREVEALNASMEKHARDLVEAVATLVMEPLLVEDYPALETYLGTLASKNPSVRSVHVRRRDGALVASSAAPGGDAPGDDGSQRIYRANVVLSGIGPRGHIGEVILGVSTAASQSLLRTRMRAVAVTAIVTSVALITVLGILFQCGVVSRISRLQEWAFRIGKGDLERSIPMREVDELGQLARAFERMRVDLVTAFEERDRIRREIQSSRDHLTAVFAGTPDGIIVFDSAGIIQSMNPFAESLFGRPEASVLGEPLSTLIPDFSVPKSVEDSQSSRGRAVEGQRVCGASLSLRLSIGMYTLAGTAMGVAIVSDASTVDSLQEVELVPGLSATARDAVENRAKTLLELNERLVETQGQLLQSQKMESLGQLAGGVAHDFNNLLMIINGHAEELLEEADVAESSREELQQILEAGRQAAALTQQLLAFGRKQVFQTQLVDLATVVTDAERLVRRLLDSNIRLELPLPTEPACVEIDVVQLQQIILNLALNARDAMPEGGTLTLETGRRGPQESAPGGAGSRPPGARAYLTVTDTGRGMTPHTKEHLFEPFFTTKALGHGTGLGLSTTLGIVQQSGGHIEVESELNQGCRISVLLPLHDAPLPNAQKTQEPQATDPDSVPERPASTGASSKLILVVEDQEEVRGLIRQILRGRGYEVVEATNGLEALERLAERGAHAYRMILSDIRMPEMGGRELAIRVARDHPELKIVLMSGNALDTIDEELTIAPRLGFLKKPFLAKTLLTEVAELL